MPGQPIPEPPATPPNPELVKLNERLELLEAREKLALATQTQAARTARILADALKEQAASQLALGVAQAQLPFAGLQGIKAGIDGITLPTGKEGTIAIAKGAEGAALLRSKGPLLDLLDEIAGELVTLCPGGAVLVTEEQLTTSHMARYTLERIGVEQKHLLSAVETVRGGKSGRDSGFESVTAGVIAGAYTAGLALDTLNSLGKLWRTDRKLEVYDANAEALSLLGHLIESKCSLFVVNPARLSGQLKSEADQLLQALGDLGIQIQIAKDALPKTEEGSPVEEKHSQLQAAIDRASTLLEGLDPSKKPDDFWKQVTGQVLAAKMQDRKRLLLDLKAQAVQITESRWYTSDCILALGEVLLAYRVLDANDHLEKSGVLLRTSPSETLVETHGFGQCMKRIFGEFLSQGYRWHRPQASP